MQHLTKKDACRIAVRAQHLHAHRPTGLLPLVRQLTLLQLDPTAAIAPSAELVVWSRLGPAADPADLSRALTNRTLIELRATLRPAEDLALHRADMAAWPGTGERKSWQHSQQRWVEANDTCRLDILHRLTSGGPLTSRQIPDSCTVPWRSTGWTNNRNVVKLLELMVDRGEVAIAGRARRERLWDLAERVYPDTPAIPLDEALPQQNRRRLHALGIARARGPESRIEPLDVADAGEEVTVEGTPGTWRIDATADRRAGLLRLNALHWDVNPTPSMITAVHDEIASLATWLGLDLAPT